MRKHIYFLLITITYFITFLFTLTFAILLFRFKKIPKIIKSLGNVTDEAKDVIYNNKELPFDDEQDYL